eukprot:598184-Hanusia_phi.AAC.2
MEMLLLSLAEPEVKILLVVVKRAFPLFCRFDVFAAQIFFEQLFELTIRHIRYGVRPEYLSPFGTALFLTLEEVEGRGRRGRDVEGDGCGRTGREEGR